MANDVRVACAWCLEPLSDGAVPVSRISHCICERCLDEADSEASVASNDRESSEKDGKSS